MISMQIVKSYSEVYFARSAERMYLGGGGGGEAKSKITVRPRGLFVITALGI